MVLTDSDQLRICNSNDRIDFYSDILFALDPKLRERFLDRSLTETEYKSYRRNTIRRVHREINRRAKKYGFHGRLFSTKMRTVGVQGDARTYRYAAEVWGQYSDNLDNLNALSREIVNEMDGISRVLYRIE